MAKQAIEIPNLDLYDKLVATIPEIQRLGKTMPYTAANTHMFSMLTKDGRFGIRLPKKDQEEFLKKYKSIPFKNYGSFMKDYVEVPLDLLKKTDELKPYLQKSYNFVMSLKPNPRKN